MQKRFQINLSSRARHNLKRIPMPWQARIVEAIDAISQNPFLGIKMWGELDNKRKVRIWPYRILYEVNEKQAVIYILNIGHRGSIGY
ncbi:MAG: type II toxin-antitoxin system RelE/ParE family toxin [bacterium]